MRREAIVAFFTVVLVGIGSFGLDIIKGLIAGKWDAVLIGVKASIIGASIALLMTGVFILERTIKEINKKVENE